MLIGCCDPPAIIRAHENERDKELLFSFSKLGHTDVLQDGGGHDPPGDPPSHDPFTKLFFETVAIPKCGTHLGNSLISHLFHERKPEMTSKNLIAKVIIALVLTLTATVGTGVVAEQVGFEGGAVAYAGPCSSGGGC